MVVRRFYGRLVKPTPKTHGLLGSRAPRQERIRGTIGTHLPYARKYFNPLKRPKSGCNNDLLKLVLQNRLHS